MHKFQMVRTRKAPNKRKVETFMLKMAKEASEDESSPPPRKVPKIAENEEYLSDATELYDLDNESSESESDNSEPQPSTSATEAVPIQVIILSNYELVEWCIHALTV